MKNKNNIFGGRGVFSSLGFTLIEIMVAITIFMIVMVSVMQIFGVSSQLTNKIDINRQVQENIKNLTETIAEDMRMYGIEGISDKNDITGNYDLSDGNGLKLGNNKYYISNSDNLNRLLDITECKDLKNNCFLVKDDGEKSKLTNSWVAFEDLNFTIMGDDIKKLVINFTMRPSTKKGILSNLIKNSKVIFQTTISERFVKTN